MAVQILVMMLFLCSDFPKIASVEKSFGISRYDETRNISSNVSTACQLEMDQPSLKKILKLIHQQKNAIEFNVFIEPLNTLNTLNRSRLLTGIKWANKVGRTLVSLIAGAERSFSMILSSYTTTLILGVDTVDITVSEATEGCLLLSRKNASDIVFNFLLDQLFLYSNEDDPEYQLCVKKSDDDGSIQYNCCGLFGAKRIQICSDYSSIILISLTGLVFGAMFFFALCGFPLMFEQLEIAKKGRTEYKLSESPMSLSSIFYIIFIEGHGPAKSLGRRLVFAVFIFITVLPEWDFDYLWLYISLGLWAILFLFHDVYGFNKEDNRNDIANRLRNDYEEYKNTNETIALPFNLKLFWNTVKEMPFFREHFEANVVNGATSDQQSATGSPTSEHSRLLAEGELQQNTFRQAFRRIVDVQYYRFYVAILLIIYLLIFLPALIIYALNSLLLTRLYYKMLRKKWTLVLFGTITFVLILISFVKCCILMLYSIVGIYLNAGYYSTYYVPLCIILFYSWSKWKSSVEEKYLELNTNIYKACRKRINTVQGLPPVTQVGRSETSDNENDENNSFRFEIKLDENGEPVIPKPLYDIVREKFLPYHDILVPYFERVVLVIVLAYFLFIFMSLAQTSGVSSNVPIISTMAVTSLPLLFDIMWEKNSEGRQAAKNCVLKSKLKRVLEVCSSNNDTGEIMVKYTGAVPTDPFGDNTF